MGEFAILLGRGGMNDRRHSQQRDGLPKQNRTDMPPRPSSVKHLIDTCVDAAGDPYYFIDPRWHLLLLDPRIPTPVAMRNAPIREIDARIKGIYALAGALGEKRTDESLARCSVWYDIDGARAEHYLRGRSRRKGRASRVIALVLPVVVLTLVGLQLFAASDEPIDWPGMAHGAAIAAVAAGALIAAVIAWRRGSSVTARWAIAATLVGPWAVTMVTLIIRDMSE